MNPKIISSEDLALFAMQLLTPEENAEIITHLEHNEAARNELAQLQGDLAMYALISDLHSPPAQARERLLRRVAKEKKLVPVERVEKQASPVSDEPVLMPRGGRIFQMEEETRQARGGIGFLTWAGWAVAAGLAVGAGFEFHQRQILQESVSAQNTQIAKLNNEAAKAQTVMQALTDKGAQQIALHATTPGADEASRPEAHAAYLADSGSMVFVASHLAPLQPYKTYELWVIPADGHDPIAAGTFKPDERGYASVILPQLQKGIIAGKIAVTLEDDPGGAAPGGPIVMAGL